MKYLLFLIIFSISPLSFSQNITINVGEGKYILDETLNLIVCNEDITNYTNLTGSTSVTIVLNGNNYIFSTVPNSIVYGIQYLVNYNSQEYKLYFSQLPLINITPSQEIVDEPKVSASFIFTDTTSAQSITSFCGIEYRGGLSQTYPKKSFSIEFWLDETGVETKKLSFLNMRNDDDWMLLAMYKEVLKIRSAMNLDLWRKIHTPYYIDREPDALATIRTKYVEVAVNNEYLGIYAFGEKVDRKQLKLKKYNNAIRGEIYKGSERREGTIFYDLPPYDNQLPPYDNTIRLWAGFEMKYPKESEITDWSNLYNFANFVIYEPGASFQQNISSKFKLENAIDYFIFLNLLNAVDNRGKNLYIAKYKENEPYFYVPWDLDGTWGVDALGEQDNNYETILVNGLYTRLLNSANNIFKDSASNRWAELRTDILDETNLKNTLSQTYNFLFSNGNYEREVLKWGEQSVELSNLNYTYQWIEDRLIFLDNYFESTILSTNTYLAQKNTFTIYPNPVNTSFKIESSIKPFYYKIYTLNGLLLQKGTLSNDKTINIQGFTKGVYMITLFNNNNRYLGNSKLIKN